MRKLRWPLLPLAAFAGLIAYYADWHPLVFMAAHRHCIKQAGLALRQYADAHGGHFPADPKGYGNALLLLDEDCYFSLTGPGYDTAPFLEAKRTGGDLPEAKCGRVYIQGLTEKSNHELVLLFDKLPTPGGDHCHFPARMFRPLGREVAFVDGSIQFVPEAEWPVFAQHQVALVVKEGFPRSEAERLWGTK